MSDVVSRSGPVCDRVHARLTVDIVTLGPGNDPNAAPMTVSIRGGNRGQRVDDREGVRRRPRAHCPSSKVSLPIDPARVPTDLIAGATLAALAIPETMGYATMAGMPVVTGLYTIVVPLFLFAIFGSSRHLVVGADSATAVVLAAGLAGMGAVSGTPNTWRWPVWRR